MTLSSDSMRSDLRIGVLSNRTRPDDMFDTSIITPSAFMVLEKGDALSPDRANFRPIRSKNMWMVSVTDEHSSDSPKAMKSSKYPHHKMSKSSTPRYQMLCATLRKECTDLTLPKGSAFMRNADKVSSPGFLTTMCANRDADGWTAHCL